MAGVNKMPGKYIPPHRRPGAVSVGKSCSLLSDIKSAAASDKG
ncbi:hypothetical protein ACFL96_04350 [Thermoproteota archaeon]